jgi:hypothetical protein
MDKSISSLKDESTYEDFPAKAKTLWKIQSSEVININILLSFSFYLSHS